MVLCIPQFKPVTPSNMSVYISVSLWASLSSHAFFAKAFVLIDIVVLSIVSLCSVSSLASYNTCTISAFPRLFLQLIGHPSRLCVRYCRSCYCSGPCELVCARKETLQGSTNRDTRLTSETLSSEPWETNARGGQGARWAVVVGTSIALDNLLTGIFSLWGDRSCSGF